MSRPRVLFVSHMDGISGAEQVLVDLAKAWRDAAAFVFRAGPLSTALSDLGLDVTIPTGGNDLSVIRKDKPLLLALPSTLATISGLVGALARRARDCDLVYANSQKAFTLSALACLMARRPLIWHLHDSLDRQHFGATQRRMQITLANRLASRVIVPSEAAAAAFRAAGGRPGHVATIANGRDLAIDPAGKAELRQRLGLPAGPLVGVFSRLAAWKGQDVFLRALARCPDVTGIVVGSAMFAEDDFEMRLKALAREVAIEHRVRFLGRREDVPALMQAMDAVVHPSVAPEPFGLTLVEAMLVGVAVVASSTGACSEILADGRCGQLVEPGSVDGFAAAMRTAVAAPDAVRRQVAAATERARTVYSLARMQNGISALIHAHAAGAKP
ncbi:MAG: glycosyltransferase family 4 protein [Ancalomicrobiaceae bacterium]|nr:glycosyltransferase family 4 protein [Ancalomicrobiaceae bacterium]